jgi:hypothetical protein
MRRTGFFFSSEDCWWAPHGPWIGTGRAAIARPVVPIIKPKAYLPVHRDGLCAPFSAGLPRPYSDRALEQFSMKPACRSLSPNSTWTSGGSIETVCAHRERRREARSGILDRSGVSDYPLKNVGFRW